MKLDKFTKSYIMAALWASTDEDGNPLDDTYTTADIHPSAMAGIIEDCRTFQVDNGEHIEGRERQAGHDFWLTRCRHGSGFWDGDWPQDVSRLLTDKSHSYGVCHLYVGDDGWLYYR